MIQESMSHIYNERYLEAALENFESALQDGDIATAKAVVADLRDAGFSEKANYLAKRLAPTSALHAQMEVINAALRKSV